MTDQSAYAPYDISYTKRTPYITVTEYQNAPTSMDISNLIAGGDWNVQMMALQETIARASSWIDQYTCGAWGTLAATQQVENGRVWGNRYGQLVVHPKYWPILSIDAFSYGLISSPSWGFGGDMAGGVGSTAASITPAGNVWIEPQQFIVQPVGAVQWNVNAAQGIGTGQYECQWTYTSGWPVTELAAPATAGDTSITLVDVTGIVPGTRLSIYDMPNDEPIMVSQAYTPGTLSVALGAPLVHSHAISSMVTNIPPAVKQAAILATTAFIKQRGSGAMVVQDIGEVTRTQTGPSQNSGSDWNQAQLLLEPFKQTFVGY
jgi:hypothetical protein